MLYNESTLSAQLLWAVPVAMRSWSGAESHSDLGCWVGTVLFIHLAIYGQKLGMVGR